jgi:hypothetical protein
LAAARTKHGNYGAEARAFGAAIDVLLRGAPKPSARSRGVPPAREATSLPRVGPRGVNAEDDQQFSF